jgi:hypothetical protein
MSKAYIGLLEKANTAVVASDTAEKDFFLEVYSELKSGDDYETIVSHIKELVPEMVTQRQLITVVNMAKDYVGSKMFTKIIDMRWYNLKALVALIRYINKEHGKNAVTGIKRKISNVGRKHDKVADYNNALDVLIKQIKGEYKVVITDDSKVLTTNVKAMFNGLTTTQKGVLLKMLLAEQKDNKGEK